MVWWILAALAFAGAALYFWGRFLPRSRYWSQDLLIEAPVERVWLVLTDFVRQVEWRTDLRSVETGTGPAGEEWWRERPRLGPGNWFRVLRCRRARVVEVERLPNGFCAGRWTVTLEGAARSSRITLSETIIIERPLARVMGRVWLHGRANAPDYLRDLKRYIESRPT